MNSPATETALRARLLDAGVQPTRRRLALARLLFGGPHHHFTAEELWARARAAEVKVSLATVYTTLNQFVAAGLLAEARVGGERTCYDTNTAHHSHAVDESTGALIDLPDAAVRVVVAPELLPPGTAIRAVDVVVRVRRA